MPMEAARRMRNPNQVATALALAAVTLRVMASGSTPTETARFTVKLASSKVSTVPATVITRATSVSHAPPGVSGEGGGDDGGDTGGREGGGGSDGGGSGGSEGGGGSDGGDTGGGEGDGGGSKGDAKRRM